jgi:hypothetical protein
MQNNAQELPPRAWVSMHGMCLAAAPVRMLEQGPRAYSYASNITSGQQHSSSTCHSHGLQGFGQVAHAGQQQEQLLYVFWRGVAPGACL